MVLNVSRVSDLRTTTGRLFQIDRPRTLSIDCSHVDRELFERAGTNAGISSAG